MTQPFVSRSPTPKLLLLLALSAAISVACGRDRGSMRVTRRQQTAAGTGRAGSGAASTPPGAVSGAASQNPAAAKPAAPLPPQVRVFRGLYLRNSDSSAFKPCVDKDYHRVIGEANARGREAIALLRERFRWTTPFIGRPLFAVFRGYLEPDTGIRAPRPDPNSHAAPSKTVPMRFVLTKLDSLRPREPGDCDSQK